MPSALRAPMSRATILSWFASGLPVPNDVVGFTPASALFTTPSISIERRVTMAYSFSSTCVLLRVMSALSASRSGVFSALMRDRAAGLIWYCSASRPATNTALPDAEMQVSNELVRIARQRDVAEPAAPAHRRAFGAVRLPHGLLVVVREQFRRQRIRDAIGALVLRQRRRLDQRPDVELHREPARIPDGLQARSAAAPARTAGCR